MIDWSENVAKVEAAMVALYVYDEGELYSMGSGVVFNKHGYVMTAAHVITANKKLESEEITSGSVLVLGRTKAGQTVRYIPVIMGPTFSASYFREPMQIDTAILAPVPQQTTTEFIAPTERAPVTGEAVLIGGYPEEVGSPFDFERHIDPRQIAGFKDMKSFEQQLETFNRLP